MLVTLKADPILSLTLPGKVQSYMAVGKPIIGAINGETRLVIEKARCGLCGPAEDYVELADNIKLFISDKINRREFAEAAKKYYKENFGKQIFMEKIEKIISD